MDARLVRRLIAQGEGPTIEFKREVDLSSREGQAEFCKDLMSLANIMRSMGKTSYLLIGVDDSGEIVGMKAPLTHQQLKNAADLYCQPPVVFRYWQGLVDGKLVGVVVIPQSYRKPHKFKREFSSEKKKVAENTVFTRHLSHVVVASPEEIVALDQEAALLRRRRRAIISAGILVAFIASLVLAFMTGLAYNQKIQEFATLLFPGGLPLLPSGSDPRTAPLSIDQVEGLILSLPKNPFVADYASRYKYQKDEYVTQITIEYSDPNNWKATARANYGYVASRGHGELIYAVKDGKCYTFDVSTNTKEEDEKCSFRRHFIVFDMGVGLGDFEQPPDFDSIAIAHGFSPLINIKKASYKPWAKMVRVAGLIARVYESRSEITIPRGIVPRDLKGTIIRRAYVNPERNILLRHETIVDVPAEKGNIYYEIGFNVRSYGQKTDIDWSFLGID
jgi:hypothetical protein